MNPKKVSIVLPTFNGAKYIKESIESCIAQTYKNLEIILVDDGSSDSTQDIVKEFSDPRIKYIRHEKNSGLPISLNTGFAASSGDYLTWHSDDNIYAKNAIEKMAEFLDDNPDVGFVYADCWLIDENGKTIRQGKMRDARHLDRANCIGSCFMYRREVYKKIGGYNPEYKLAEDYEYWLRVRQSFKMARIKELLYYYRVHKNSLTVATKVVEIVKQTEKASWQYIKPSMRHYHKAQEFFYRKMFKEAQKEVGAALIKEPFNFFIWRFYIFLQLKIFFPWLADIVLKFLFPELAERIKNQT